METRCRVGRVAVAVAVVSLSSLGLASSSLSHPSLSSLPLVSRRNPLPLALLLSFIYHFLQLQHRLYCSCMSLAVPDSCSH